MEIALYDPDGGYYTRSENPLGKGGDYVTSGQISPVFGFALGRLAQEFVARSGDDVCAIVDIGCGDGSLLRTIARAVRETTKTVRLLGVDRALSRVAPQPDDAALGVLFSDRLEFPPGEPLLIFSNELYDAFPFARLVQREDGLREIWVRASPEEVDWTERPAAREYQEYFARQGVSLVPGQFADVSLEWGRFHREICRRSGEAMIVTFDYGFRSERLFDRRARLYGTAAAYSGHQVHRDLLRTPGLQDLTAHVNFSDLIQAGGDEGFSTAGLWRQAEFLLRLGAQEHPLLQPLKEVEVTTPAGALELREERELARRLVLPEGIGQEISALVQVRGVPNDGWSFQRALW